MGCYVSKPLKEMSAYKPCHAIRQPLVNTATYTAQIDFYQKHITGLWIFKAMDDTTERVVFMTETGFKFFDFEFSPHNFQVKYIVRSLNKKLIVHTFKKDIGYIVMPPNENSIATVLQSDTNIKYTVSRGKAYSYYSTDTRCEQLQKIEEGTAHIRTLVITMKGNRNKNPETINIAHQSYKLNILLKQIDDNASTTTP